MKSIHYSQCFRRSKYPANCVRLLLRNISYVKDELITIVVGKDKTSFKVYKSLLVERIPYFQRRLKDCWDSDKKGIIEMEDLDIDGFEVIIDWMYHAILPERLTRPVNKYDSSLNARTYKVADQLMMTDLQNRLVDNELSLNQESKMAFGRVGITWCWELGLTHTPYYQLVLKDCTRDMITNSVKDVHFTDQITKLMEYPEALADIIKIAKQYGETQYHTPTIRDRCDYHIHENDMRCDSDA